MLARRPSLNDSYEYISSADDALDIPVARAKAHADANEKARAAFAHKLEVARDTGDYSAVLREGKQPTRFVLRQLPTLTMRRLLDDLESKRLGTSEWLAIVFCCAVEDVVADGIKVKHIADDRYGQRATSDLLAAFPDAAINEIALAAWKRAQSLAPKS